MFCTKCGSDIGQGQVCERCGAKVKVAAATPRPVMADISSPAAPGGRPALVTALAVWQFITAGLIVITMYGLSMFVANMQGSPPLFALIAVFAGLAILCGAAAASGVGLLALRPYGRALLLALSVVELVIFPIGTVISIFVIRYVRRPAISSLFIAGNSKRPGAWSMVPRSRAAMVTSSVLAAAALLAAFSVARQRPDVSPVTDNSEATIEGTAAFYPTSPLEFHNAVDKGDLALVKRLLTRGADVNERDDKGWTPLHLAVTRRAWVKYDLNIAMVELLLANGAEVNTTSKGGSTPLHTAAFFRSAKAIELLLAKGADSNTRDANGEIPLHQAANSGTLEAAAMLLAAGSDINAVGNADGGGTPLHYATKRRDRELVALLLTKGADVHVMDNTGATPLVALLIGPPGLSYTKEIAELLRQHGARAEPSQTDLRVGSGADATPGRRLTVHYTGWLYDPTQPEQKGRQLDTSVGHQPFAFTLGGGQAIPGWDQGVAGMKVGGQRRLVIPPELAYGSSGTGGDTIEPHSTLVFDVELLDVQ